MRRIIIACALAGFFAGPAFGQGVDPLMGLWKLNLEKSTYIGSLPAPKSQTLTFSGEGQNFINTVETVDAQGRASKQVNMHIYDGMPHPTTGNLNYDASAYTRTGNSMNVIRLRNGKPVVVLNEIIVPGKTLTLIGGGIDRNDQPFYEIVVYYRQ